jgi:hypothetical protein
MDDILKGMDPRDKVAGDLARRIKAKRQKRIDDVAFRICYHGLTRDDSTEAPELRAAAAKILGPDEQKEVINLVREIKAAADKNCKECGGKGVKCRDGEVEECPCLRRQIAKSQVAPTVTVDVKPHAVVRQEELKARLEAACETLKKAEAESMEAVRPIGEKIDKLRGENAAAFAKIKELRTELAKFVDEILCLAKKKMTAAAEVTLAETNVGLALDDLGRFVETATATAVPPLGAETAWAKTFSERDDVIRSSLFDNDLPRITNYLRNAIGSLDKKRTEVILFEEQTATALSKGEEISREELQLSADNASAFDEIKRLEAEYERVAKHREPKVRKAADRVRRLEYLLGGGKDEPALGEEKPAVTADTETRADVVVE